MTEQEAITSYISLKQIYRPESLSRFMSGAFGWTLPIPDPRGGVRYRAVMADSVLRALEMIIDRLPEDGNLAKEAALYYLDICAALNCNSLTFCLATLSGITEMELED